MASKTTTEPIADIDVDALRSENARLLARIAELEGGRAPAPFALPDASKPTEVRVLTSCSFGKGNDVVTLQGADLLLALEQGVVDSNPDAVAAARRIRIEEADAARARAAAERVTAAGVR